MALRSRSLATLVLALLALGALGAGPAAGASNGGVGYGQTSQAPPPGGTDPSVPLPDPMPSPLAPPAPPTRAQVARVLSNGRAVAPAGAPVIVQQMIASGNRIARTKYVWGGGHARWEDRGYDCSGSVSYVLHGAGLLGESLVSGDLARWGDRGAGSWVTIYANANHVYMTIAGLRFDTSGQSRAGTRWQAPQRSNRGFKVRHPAGL